MSWLSETLFGTGPNVTGAQRTASAAINPLAEQIRNFQGFGTIGSVDIPTFGSLFDVQNGGFGVREAGQQYAEQLGLMAQPAEATAANQLANRLFSTGRLGTSGGSQQMADLAQAQQMAATQRGLQGLGFATDLQSQLINQQLAQRGQDIGIQSQLFGGLQSAAQLQAAPYLAAQQMQQGTPGILGGLGSIGQFVGGLGQAGVFG